MWVLGMKEEGAVYMIWSSHTQTQYAFITQLWIGLPKINETTPHFSQYCINSQTRPVMGGKNTP